MYVEGLGMRLSLEVHALYLCNVNFIITTPFCPGFITYRASQCILEMLLEIIYIICTWLGW